MSDIGHNSGAAGQQLRSLVQRIERLEEEKREVADQVKEVFAEAKGVGFDKKVLHAIIARRKQAREAVREFDSMVELYESALDSVVDDVLDAEVKS